jgi:hypothetical protein
VLFISTYFINCIARQSLCRQHLMQLIEYKREQWHRAARFASTTAQQLAEHVANVNDDGDGGDFGR